MWERRPSGSDRATLAQQGDLVITEPGLNFKLPPPFQNVSYIDKRLLTLESTDTEPTLTAEKQRVVIDWYVRWRISDPSAYIRNVGLDERAGALQLNRVVRNSFQQEVNKRTVNELLSTRREELMADVKREVLAAVRSADKPWGMDVVDVRITRVDYAETITKSVYDRMEAERKRVANELRSTGSADGEKIRADADRQREVILAEAYRWERWAAPRNAEGRLDHNAALTGDDLRDFVNGQLFREGDHERRLSKRERAKVERAYDRYLQTIPEALLIR